MKSSVVQLAQKLITIPSYCKNNINERLIADFIFDYLQQFSFLKVKKQNVIGKRVNIIAETKGCPRFLCAGHLDTVEPKNGINKKACKSHLKGNKLYGLGALDTKGGVAAILDALHSFKKLNNTTFLFYCDEEYDFSGMKTFLSKYIQQKSLRLALVIEPSQLKIWNAHRGLIEFSFVVRGESGHSANPLSGKNAVFAMLSFFEKIRKELKKFTSPILGESSCNISFLRGGLYQGITKKNVILGREGNNIPDYAEAVIEVRAAHQKLSGEFLKQIILQEAKKQKISVSSFFLRHDLGSLETSITHLTSLTNAVRDVLGKVEFENPLTRGYSDGQLITQYWKVPSVYFGPCGAGAHKSNEYVDILSLQKLREIYVKLLEQV